MPEVSSGALGFFVALVACRVAAASEAMLLACVGPTAQ